METATGTLQFDWGLPDARVHTRRDDYFAELVERLTAVTPEIDRLIARCLRRRVVRQPSYENEPTGVSSY
jgi:hypothetical protein